MGIRLCSILRNGKNAPILTKLVPGFQMQCCLEILEEKRHAAACLYLRNENLRTWRAIGLQRLSLPSSKKVEREAYHGSTSLVP